ncbi:hypothetical protein COT78_00290 [Candidatus Berkelbacteria bacterium CG10_big_fil_rev_8_21_14_0_10_43_13]|uniref:Uncharacterized protein n=1 Tax=Candidatus Berkelbacteria bacterium CG10_big_fil_rev_8_21_14_0_10_43_13 TaxID=1974514 RepID=A0A2H0W7K9_9BACT|nr:MAG: hypothetical protein COT78_00290 [Candidatus Berkelbacteria bacterium CG10_big_fil_rev_8_21_14_0_10_43_13]
MHIAEAMSSQCRAGGSDTEVGHAVISDGPDGIMELLDSAELLVVKGELGVVVDLFETMQSRDQREGQGELERLARGANDGH